MNELKINMVEKAMEQYCTIFPPSDKKRFEECFTIEGNRVYFWFNTPDETTHVMYAEV